MESFEWISESTALILILSTALTAAISGMIGMGGGVTLLGILTFFIPFPWIVPIHGVIQLVSNSTRTLLIRNHVRWGLWKQYALGACFGAAGSAWFFRSLDEPAIPLFLIGTMILYSVFKPKKLPPLKIPDSGFIAVGVIAGFLSLFVGAVGPFLAPFFLRPDFNKKEVVATKAAFQLFTHFLKLPAFLWIGFPYLDHFLLITLLCLAAIGGTHLGVKTLERLPEKAFFFLFKALLLFAAIRIFLKAGQSLTT